MEITLLGLASDTAKQMGLDVKVFEEIFLKKMAETRFEEKPRTYTLRFLQKFTEGGGDSTESGGISNSKAETYKPPAYSGHTSHNNSHNNSYNNYNTHKIHKTSYDNTFGHKNTDVYERGEINPNIWQPKKECNEKDKTLKKIRGDLNKIDINNEKVISERVCGLITEDIVENIIPIFFDKAVWEQKFREIYANLCLDINNKIPDIFKRSLICHCQKLFEITIDKDSLEDDVFLLAMKKRLGILNFIVELLKKNLVSPQVILSCLSSLLKFNKDCAYSGTELDEYDISHSAELLLLLHPHTVNNRNVISYICIIKNTAVSKKLGIYFKFLSDINNNKVDGIRVSQRVKFKIEDTLKVYK